MATAVFGYGSLIFKPPPFEGITFEPGYIKHHVRRFAQKSHDHRGTPDAPGRVVTLLREQDWLPHQKDEPPESHHVWGQVYTIPAELAATVWPYLDHREKDGYTLRTVDVFGVGPNGEEIVCKVYVGETDNPSFGGGEMMHDLARLIAKTVGPSGPNKEYLYKLCDSVRLLCPESEDSYLRELERLVRSYDTELN
ncbi:cation transport protein ChaC [Pseudohyphozyma bogoriensis]|nr:cation transport protein ChaC [Pseudohyphozyma bogoriensis]